MSFTKEQIEKTRRENLRRILVENKARKGTDGRFAEAAGIDRAYLSHMKSGLRPIGDEYARRIEIQAGWPKYSLDEPEGPDANIWGQELAWVGDVGALGGQQVPLISFVRAGSWGAAEDPFQPGEAEDWYCPPKRIGPRSFALRVQGDSMFNPGGQRSYAPGVIIFVDPDVYPASGSPVIAKLVKSNEVTFKILVEDVGRKFLKPLNPQYPVIEVQEECRVIGVVVGQWSE